MSTRVLQAFGLLICCMGMVIPACSPTLSSRGGSAEVEAKFVFITGDPVHQPYEAFVRLTQILEEKYPVKSELWDLSPSHFSEAQLAVSLSQADVVVLAIGGLTPSSTTLDLLRNYMEQGGATVCIQPALTPFIYPQTHPLHKWNQAFPQEYFGAGSRQEERYGPGASVSVLESAQLLPILRGVHPTFWTYTTPSRMGQLGQYTTPLLMSEPKTGALEGGECFMEGQLAAWTYMPPTATGKPIRRFYTTLGTLEDFSDSDFRTLLANAIFWANSWESHIPPEGCILNWKKATF